mmetsp:Transcript_40999/g.122509  ORF Transcript_40999/g.122509 Transcript_40999/m.122509 type:complete len:254 (+) Transcript_40999:234-995(+)
MRRGPTKAQRDALDLLPRAPLEEAHLPVEGVLAAVLTAHEEEFGVHCTTHPAVVAMVLRADASQLFTAVCILDHKTSRVIEFVSFRRCNQEVRHNTAVLLQLLPAQKIAKRSPALVWMVAYAQGLHDLNEVDLPQVVVIGTAQAKLAQQHLAGDSAGSAAWLLWLVVHDHGEGGSVEMREAQPSCWWKRKRHAAQADEGRLGASPWIVGGSGLACAHEPELVRLRVAKPEVVGAGVRRSGWAQEQPVPADGHG